MAWSCVGQGLSWILENASLSRGDWTLEQDAQGSGHSIKPDKIQEEFGQYSQAHRFFGLSCAGSEAGLDSLCRSFPAQNMTPFYDSKVKFFGDALQNASHFLKQMARVRWNSSHLTSAIWKLDEYFQIVIWAFAIKAIERALCLTQCHLTQVEYLRWLVGWMV